MKKSIHAKRMERHHKRLKGQSKLNLVSLMDIFTILVFFLLVNSSDVEVLQNNKDIDLPQSIAEQKPKNNLIVMVSKDNIIVGGRSIVPIEDAMAMEGLEIPPLKEELEYLAKRKPYRNDEERAKGRDLTIMGDKEIPYSLVKKIMSTAAQADYRNISLAASQVPDARGEAIMDEAGLGGEE